MVLRKKPRQKIVTLQWLIVARTGQRLNCASCSLIQKQIRASNLAANMITRYSGAVWTYHTLLIEYVGRVSREALEIRHAVSSRQHSHPLQVFVWSQSILIASISLVLYLQSKIECYDFRILTGDTIHGCYIQKCPLVSKGHWFSHQYMKMTASEKITVFRILPINILDG